MQILFQGDCDIRIKGESPVSRCGFSLGSGEGIFFPGFGMKKNREIFTDRFISKFSQLFCSAADNYPVPIFNRKTK